MRGLMLLTVMTLAFVTSIEQSETISARGYNRRVAIPLGDEIRKREEAVRMRAYGRIVGGSVSSIEEFPYQAGVLTKFNGINGTGVCGGSLISTNRVVHAAHCWFDGEHQGYTSEIVLGSDTLFFGGSRQSTSNIIMYPQWNPNSFNGDIAVIMLPNSVIFSSVIASIVLPSGSQLNESFAGEDAVASGFGRTNDTVDGAVTYQQSLRHANLKIITNAVCKSFFLNNVRDSNICTSGDGGASTCGGDSGGPLAVSRNGQPLLVGITSFGSFWGCTLGFPAAFTRVNSFISFINQNL